MDSNVVFSECMLFPNNFELNEILCIILQSHQKDAGFIGLTIILSGVVGSILSGLWLDRTKTFK